MAAIIVQNLHIDFPIYHGNSRSLKQTVLGAASGRLRPDSRSRVVVRSAISVSRYTQVSDSASSV